MRFHVIGLPGSRITNAPHVGNPCDTMSFSLRGIIRILYGILGHEVLFYGSDDSDINCTERVVIDTLEFRKAMLAAWDPLRNATRLRFDRNDPVWMAHNAAAISAMRSRLQPRDFILVQGGHPQAPIAEAFPANQTVEYIIGYDGSFAPFRVFQSYSHMHVTYGRQGIGTGRYFDDAGYGFYYDPLEFPRAEKKGDYYLFMGRMNRDKGPHIAAQVCNHLGARLLVAGQDAKVLAPGKIQGNGVVIEGPRVEYVGVVGGLEKARLMGAALAIFTPTQYMEPGCSTTMEANVCGTPAITTDWACFTETIVNGLNGYRTRSFAEMVEAAQKAPELDSQAITDYALSRWSEPVLAAKYKRYFGRLSTLWGKGWYECQS